jgi:hypothetical protein
MDAQKERDKSQQALATAIKVRDGQQSKINALEVTSHELSAALDKIKRNQVSALIDCITEVDLKFIAVGCRQYCSSYPGKVI